MSIVDLILGAHLDVLQRKLVVVHHRVIALLVGRDGRALVEARVLGGSNLAWIEVYQIVHVVPEIDGSGVRAESEGTRPKATGILGLVEHDVLEVFNLPRELLLVQVALPEFVQGQDQGFVQRVLARLAEEELFYLEEVEVSILWPFIGTHRKVVFLHAAEVLLSQSSQKGLRVESNRAFVVVAHKHLKLLCRNVDRVLDPIFLQVLYY